MRNLFKHNQFEDREFLNIQSELATIEQRTQKLSNIPNWHNGNGEPEKALGVNGDYYVDKDSGDIYLKENGEWI